MKNSFSFASVVFGVFGLLLVSSCDKTPPATIMDEEDPEVFISSPVAVSPGSWNYVLDGQVLPVDVRFEDDVELSHYEIWILKNDSLDYLKTSNDPWEYIMQGFLEGKSDGVNTSITLGNDPQAGAYEFRVKVWDAEGKLTTRSTYLDMTNVRDTTGPVISVNSPNTGQTFNNGSSIVVGADVSSTDDIQTVRCRLYDPENLIPVGNSTKLFINIFSTTFSLTASINGYDAVPPGDYEVEIFANDTYNNVTRKKIPVTLQ